MTTITVSQLNRYIKAIIEEDKKLSDLYIKGEISNFNRNFRSGHCYFSLKDETGSIRAVMFKSDADDLVFEPENGMAVLARAHVGVYERDGAYQLYVTDIQPDGAGAAAIAMEQLKAKLRDLGLFDEKHKKPIPEMPGTIGVVTSETGAALQDIINVISRRYPICKLLVAPAQVQGQGAAGSLICSLKALDESKNCDVIIIGRGGGSAQDLSAFSNEELAYAIFNAKTPVVSAVGHETDFAISDFVADLRAPTPSAAAELVTPSVSSIADKLDGYRDYIFDASNDLILSYREKLSQIKQKPGLKSPMDYIATNQQRLDFFSQSLYNNKKFDLSRFQDELSRRAALLDSLSPVKVLTRGYCIAFKGGETVGKASDLTAGDKLRLQFRDGFANTTVSEDTQ